MRIFRTGRLSDKQVFALALEFVTKWGTGHGTIRLADQNIPFDPKMSALFERENVFAIDAFDMVTADTKFILKFRRGIGNDVTNIEAGRQASAYFDEIGIEAPHNQNTSVMATPLQIIECTESVQKHVVFPPAEATGGTAEGANQVLAAQFAQLNDLLAQITKRSHDRLIELENENSERQSAIAVRAEEMDNKYLNRVEALENEYAARTEKVAAREQDLDDRDNTFARRQLRADMTKEIAGRLKDAIVPSRMSWLRWAVFVLTIVGSAFLGWISWTSLMEFNSLLSTAASLAADKAGSPGDWAKGELVTSGASWIVLGRGVLTAFGSVGFLLYAISWLKNMYHDDLRAHRQLERYSTDLNRASWIVETILEAKAKGGVDIPAILINGITRHLFENGTDPKEAASSNDALAALLRASASAKIGTNGIALDFNRRGTNKLADEISE